MKGDGSAANCKCDSEISIALRRVALAMMHKYPHVCQKDCLSMLKWLEKQSDILLPNSWSGDLELHLLALGLQKSIAVVASNLELTYARRFPADTSDERRNFYSIDG